MQDRNFRPQIISRGRGPLVARSVGQLVVLAFFAVAAPAFALTLRPLDVESFLVAPGQPATVRWQIASQDVVPTRAPRYVIRDYSGREVNDGTVDVVAGGKIAVTVSLTRGFYDVEIVGTGQRFGLVSLPPAGTRRDSFFALDGALSWLVPNGQMRYELVKVLHRGGISMVRERLRWSGVEPAAGQWQWDTERGYDTLRRQLAEQQVSALEVFHDAPRWTGLVEKYPANLVATAKSWRQIGQHWQAAWGAVEVWNEPDIFFGGDLPADQYVAIVKTLASAFEQGHVDATLVAGVVAHHNRRFLDCAANNGMLDLADVASFHTYGRAEQMENLVQQFHDWLVDHGHQGMPLWLTECGRPWKRGPARPPESEDAVSALDITMKAVEARACGVARYFAFVFPYYEERQNNFGMMGRLGTPLRSMAAYLQCVARLGGTKYLGDLKCGDKSVRRARVFGGDDQTALVVIYTGKIGGSSRVALDLPVVRVEGIDGRRLEPTVMGQIPVPDGLVYVWVDMAKLGSGLVEDTPAMRLYRSARKRPQHPISAAPIVMRYEYDPELVAPSANGYTLRRGDAGKMKVGVRVFNLSRREEDVTVVPEWTNMKGDAQTNVTRSIRVPAEGSVDVHWDVLLGSGFVASRGGSARIVARLKRGQPVTPLYIDWIARASEKRFPCP